MKITVAPDSLKESVTAPRAARAMARGVTRAAPEAEVVVVPMADGGEGTTEAIVEAAGGEYRTATVGDPLGRPIEAVWGLCDDGKTAVVEMARASGLERLRPSERDPARTSTHGTGELILAALEAGIEKVIVGIGGSATVDGGAGMAVALGATLLDAEGCPLEDCPGGRLREVKSVDLSGLHPGIREVDIAVASDVTNPLLGRDGAARTYGPQKGATPEQVKMLEEGLSSLADVIRRDLGTDVRGLPGAGAAGGLGAGLVAFLGARIEEGARTVAQAVGLRERMAGSNLVFTAEGRMDGQSVFGKATAHVASIAREAGVPAVGLAGCLGPGYERLYGCGFSAIVPIVEGPTGLEQALEAGESLLEAAAERVMRIWLAAAEKYDG